MRIFSFYPRKFLLTENTSLMNEEKFEFVSKSVHWIQGQNIVGTCFVLNYGYEAPLPWPQVLK